MELENIKTQTTWSDAAESINSNNLKIVTEVTKLQSATYKNKGYFKTFSDLQSAFPTAMVGSKAYVGLSYPYTIYLWQNNAWVNSGTGGDESITMDQFYTKDETDSQISALEKATDSKLTELSAEINGKFPYTNLISEKNILLGYYVDSKTGNLLGGGTNQYMAATPYILIKAKQTYFCGGITNDANYAAFYDLKWNFLIDADAQFIPTTTSEGARLKIVGGEQDLLVRLSLPINNKKLAYISQYYDEHKPMQIDFSLESPSLEQKIQKYEAINFYANELDSEQLKKKAYINQANGVAMSNETTTFNVTPFLYLQPNTIYHIGGIYTQGLYAFYDDNKAFQSADGLGVRIESKSNYHAHIFVGDTPCYFRGSVENAYINNCYVSKLVDAYYPFGADFELCQFLSSNARKLKDKKVLIIGDSISTDTYGNYKKWVSSLIATAYLPYDTNNSSVHATGFVANNNGAFEKFITRLTKIENKELYDLVLVFGGVNDFIQSIAIGEEGEDENSFFKPAVEYLFSYLIENFTQARIGIITPLRTSNVGKNNKGLYLTEYVDCIKAIANKYCFPILDLANYSGFCPYIPTFRDKWTLTEYTGGDGVTGDGIHPNAEYESKYLAPMIKSFVSTLL